MKFSAEKCSACGIKSSALGSKEIAVIQESSPEVTVGVSFQTFDSAQQ